MKAGRSRTPWIVAAAIYAVEIVTLALVVLNDSLVSDTIFTVLAILVVTSYTGFGALIASRDPGNRVGWIMLAMGGGFLLGGLSAEWAKYTYLIRPGALPFGSLAVSINNWVFIPYVTLVAILPLILPTGRLLSHRWRPVIWALVAAGALATIGTALRAGIVEVSTVPPLRVANPSGIGSLTSFLEPLLTVVGALMIVLAAVSAASLVIRFRRSEGDERQQIRWFAYVVLVAVACFCVALGFGITNPPHDSVAYAITNVAFYLFFIALGFGFPAACGIAVLRYRLWDLDLVVKKALMFAVLAVFITIVYTVLVLVVPALVFGLGSTGFNPVGLVITILVAVVFQPVRTRARRFADRVVYGRRATPYEVLSEFSDRLADAYSTDDVLPRMAQLVAGSTGADRVAVWLSVGEELVPAASWPMGSGAEPSSFLSGPDAFPVRHQGETLGAITLEMPANDPMDGSKEKLVRDLAAQAGLVLRNVRLIEELRASRRRIVTAQDERAKTLERNIHDGAQQQLVALSVKLRLAEQLSEREPARSREILGEVQTDVTDALENLRDLARGIYPPLLADKGLVVALEGQRRKSTIPVEVAPDGVGRYAPEVEATVYFCCLEALANASKYAQASHVWIRLAAAEGELRFQVEDDGVGFEPTATHRGTGLQGMADRLAALGGTLELEAGPGRGVTVGSRLPVTTKV